MGNTDRRLLVLSFDSRVRAEQTLLSVVRLQMLGHLVVHDAVFVTRAPDGRRSVVEETVDPNVVDSAFGGGFWGLLFGSILGGPVGGLVGAGAGAGAGALAAKLIDFGVTDDTIQRLRTTIGPGMTALALLVSHVERQAVVEELSLVAGAHLVESDFSPELEGAIRAALERKRDERSLYGDPGAPAGR